MPMLKIGIRCEIKRPVEDVFGYLTDPANLPEWNPAVLHCRVEPTGPIRVGSKLHLVSRILGRRFESTLEVTEFTPNKKFAYRSNSPFPIEATYLAQPTAGGTKLTVESIAEPAGFFKLAGPVLGRLAKKQIQADHETMKELLEAREPAKVGK